MQTKKDNTDQKMLDKAMRKRHSKKLGLNIPENYFSKSKQEILSKVLDKNKKEKPVFTLKKSLVWYAAASILLLITITLIKPNSNLQIDEIHTVVSDTIKHLENEKLAKETITPVENDILITSLFIEENKIDDFIDNYVLDEALIDEAF